MASLAHRSKVRRAERKFATEAGRINLVPLVDILTSIVFFSLATYTGEALAELTAYDLTLPPVVINQAPGAERPKDALNLLFAVRVDNNRLQVEHSEQGGFKRELRGFNEQSLDQMQALAAEIRRTYPQNEDVLVVPSDDVSYDNVIKVLERLRLANFRNISLGNRARDMSARG